MNQRVCLLIAASLLFGLAVWPNQDEVTLAPQSAARAEEPGANEATPRPVAESVHQFMEYVFELPYARLRKRMAEEPKDKESWNIVKSDSLILAEGGNLLLFRAPEEDRREWYSRSVTTRKLGGQLYQAARKRDYKVAREHYAAMIANCNACHVKFAGGEPQLEP